MTMPQSGRRYFFWSPSGSNQRFWKPNVSAQIRFSSGQPTWRESIRLYLEHLASHPVFDVAKRFSIRVGQQDGQG